MQCSRFVGGLHGTKGNAAAGREVRVDDKQRQLAGARNRAEPEPVTIVVRDPGVVGGAGWRGIIPAKASQKMITMVIMSRLPLAVITLPVTVCSRYHPTKTWLAWNYCITVLIMASTVLALCE